MYGYEYYDSFDCEVQCEEVYNEAMLGFEEWLEETAIPFEEWTDEMLEDMMRGAVE